MPGLSMTDLSDPLTVEEAAAGLDRAEGGGEAALAAWARRWGRPAVTFARDVHAVGWGGEAEGEA